MDIEALRPWFDREVEPFLRENAGALERLSKRSLYPVALIVVLCVGAAGMGLAERPWPALICLAVLIPTVAVANVRLPLYQAGGTAFRSLFKERVVARIVAGVLPGATYEPDLALARSVVDASGLFDGEGVYDGDDLVRGAIGQTPFALGDVRARAGGFGGTFHGLLFHAEFNRSLAGRTLVVPRGQQPPQLARIDRGLQPVLLESPEFAAAFSVYASDAVEARYVLTPRAMERLVALARSLGRPLAAAFDGRRVYVAADNGHGAFEALSFAGEKAWEVVRGFALLFDGARAIVDELELNTRIWTKAFAPEAEAQAASVSQPSAWSRVAAQGAWAFQERPSLPFSADDRPVPPARTHIERRPHGVFRARYAPSGLARCAVILVLAAGLMAVDPAWWAAHPALELLGFATGAVRGAGAAGALLAASLLVAVLYGAAHRVRWMEVHPGALRLGRLGPARRLKQEDVRRVFAAEDLVMAFRPGSWTPVLLSPRLGSHGAARWMAGAIEDAMNGGRA